MKKFVLLLLSLSLISGCNVTETEVIPLPPGNLVATVVSTSQVDLVWKDNSTNETGFKIERKTDAGTFAEIGTTAKDITTFSDQTVSLNTTYTYRVYSSNPTGKSLSYSNEVIVKTISVPTLTTTSLTEVTAVGAKSGGNISSDGGSPITARGVVWSTEPAPTIAVATKTADGTGTGAFPSALTGLTGNIKYYIRAYATNAAGTSYGDELSFTTTAAAVLPSITTVTVTEITTSGAKTGGSITSDGNSPITARGVVWGTATAPSIALATKTNNGSGSGAFVSSITGLAANTKYYARAYATNGTGTGYGNEFSFTTTVDATIPSITTVSVTEITASGAKTGGSITADGNSPITARGVVWGTATAPTIALATKTSNGSGSGAFVSSIIGLAANTKYYIRAYATNGTGTGYGNEFSFTTTADATVPSITTVSVTEITASGAKTGGSITSDGNSPITARGVVWGTATAPTIALATKTSNGSGSGAFVSSITGLAANTKYYVRAYATNNVGTGYGNEFSFTTTAVFTAGLPNLTTYPVTEVTSYGAKSGGYAEPNGSITLTGRGVVWSTAPGPTVSLATKTSNGIGFFGFLSVITDLTPKTKYYLRAYVSSTIGTGYGNEITFTTDSVPAVTTFNSVSQTVPTTANAGGTVIADGGSPVTAKGMVWSTNSNPTVVLATKTNDGNGLGGFQSSLVNLIPNQRYYVRAYATNSSGTGYGAEVTFVTLPANSIKSTTGKIWMDKNLGAAQIATSSTDVAAFGDLYQWGRDEDGHQKRTSATTPTLSTVDTPNSVNFISASTGVQDWRSPQNANLWQGGAGINNPCPNGFRLPTEVEWTTEIVTWTSKNAIGAFASSLKLPMAGTRSNTGTISLAGGNGYYWSSSVDGTRSRILSINSAVIGSQVRAQGASVRCIKN